MILIEYRPKIISIIFCAVLLVSGCSTNWSNDETEHQNVLFIICDDLNDYISMLEGYPDIKTPGIDHLAENGICFVNAHTNVGLCQPSRNSLFTGIYPHSSKDFGWTPHYNNPLLKNRKTFVELFRENGYLTMGTGKLLHKEVDSIWTKWGVRRNINYGPFVWNGSERIGHPSVPEPFRSINIVDGSFAPISDLSELSGCEVYSWRYGWDSETYQFIDDDNRDPLPDEMHASWAVEMIRELESSDEKRPFFLGVGFVKPHTPLYAPQKYFDRFPLNSLSLPVTTENDAEDTYYSSVYPQSDVGLHYYNMLLEAYPEGEQGLKLFLQAYLACIAFVDNQIATVINALDSSKFKDNTLVILTSDHGWQMAEKNYLYKNSPWEASTRIPFIIRDPGNKNAGSKVHHPVSLIDIYPTLVDLCNLEGSTLRDGTGIDLEGYSLRPFLEDPDQNDWEGPMGALTLLGASINKPIEGIGISTNPSALWHIEIQGELPDSMVMKQSYSFRTEDWRYILYRNGMEELYNHRNDPDEWTNLAQDETYGVQKENLKKQVLNMINN